MTDEDVITMLQGIVLSLASLPEEQRNRIRREIINKSRENKPEQRLVSIGMMIESINLMLMEEESFGKAMNFVNNLFNFLTKKGETDRGQNHDCQ